MLETFSYHKQLYLTKNYPTTTLNEKNESLKNSSINKKKFNGRPNSVLKGLQCTMSGVKQKTTKCTGQKLQSQCLQMPKNLSCPVRLYKVALPMKQVNTASAEIRQDQAEKLLQYEKKREKKKQKKM